jgi:hypothetical protein
MNIGPPGKRHRCPACQTPFVVGSRTNAGAPGEPEYMAFEVFDAQAAPARPSTVRPKPAAKSKPPAKKPAPKPRPAGTGTGFDVVPDDNKLDVDFELSLDEDEDIEPLLPNEFGLVDELQPIIEPPPPKKSEPPPRPTPPSAERKPALKPVPPAPKPPPKSAPPGVRKPLSPLLANALRAAARPIPMPPALDEPAAPPAPPPAPPEEDGPRNEATPIPAAPLNDDVHEKVEPPVVTTSPPAVADVDREAGKNSAPATLQPLSLEIDHARPEAEPPQPEPVPPPNLSLEMPPDEPAGISDDDLSLPEDFLDYLDTNPEPKAPVPPPPPVVRPPAVVVGREIAPPPAPSAEAGFTVVSRPGSQPAATAVRDVELEFAERGGAAVPPQPQAPVYQESDPYEPDYDYPRGPYEETPTRANWLFAFWGVSAVLAGLGIDVIALIVIILSGAIGLLGFEAGTWSGLAGAGALMFIAFALLTVQQGVTILGYGLCLGSPARGTARLWAVVTMCLAVAGIALSGSHFVLANSQILGRYHWVAAGLYPTVAVVELLKWVFFLVYLLALGRAMRNRSVEEEVSNTLKMTIAVSVVVVFVVLTGVCAIPALFKIGVESGDVLTAGRLAMIVGVLTWVIVIGAILLVLVRQVMLLMHVRERLA